MSQLSTGEQVYLALAGDLARRLAAVTPEGTDPLQGRAVVLIDELELHLHPKWQRAIAPWLLKTFPQCQFIVSTHSPQVLSEVGASHVRILEETPTGAKIATARRTKGRDSNHLLASVFDTTEREASAESLLRRADKAISMGELAKAGKLIADIECAIEGSPPEAAVLRSRLARRT